MADKRMTDDLTELALVFCQKCLLWDTAARGIEIDRSGNETPIIIGKPGRAFNPADLNAVMASVLYFCNLGVEVDFSLQYDKDTKLWRASIGDGIDVAASGMPSACHALLAVCIKAAPEALMQDDND